MVIKKGVKARKKRLGGGGGSGSFPTNNVGVMSESHLSAGTGSGLTQASLSLLQVNNAFSGAAIAGSNVPVEAADYIATVIQGETPINKAGGSAMNAGVITLPNCAGTTDVTLQLVMAVYDPNRIVDYKSSECIITIQNNPNSIGVIGTNTPVALGSQKEAVCRIDLATAGASANDFIIAEFKMNLNGGSVTTGTTSAQAGAVKNGSMYLKIVFS